MKKYQMINNQIKEEKLVRFVDEKNEKMSFSHLYH